MAVLEINPVQLNNTITRVKAEQKKVFAANDEATIKLPAVLYLSSTALAGSKISVKSENFEAKEYNIPTSPQCSILYLGADIFGNRVKISNTSTASFTAVVIQK